MKSTHNEELPIDRIQMLNIATISALVWISLGSLIIWFMPDADALGILQAGQPVLYQLVAGIVTGGVMGYTGIRLMQVQALREVANTFGIVRIIRNVNLTARDSSYISLTAGVSEEWLFRAALIPFAGLAISSLLFVVVHGYIRFNSAAHVFFALFMLLLSLVLGLLFLYQGIFAAMAAHTVYDVAAFHGIKKQREAAPAE